MHTHFITRKLIDEDDCLVGHIAGINDIIGFHANSVPELHTAFEEAVDDYLQTCKQAGRSGVLHANP